MRTVLTTDPRGLSQFTDEQISREYYLRALRQLGDQRTCVGIQITA